MAFWMYHQEVFRDLHPDATCALPELHRFQIPGGGTTFVGATGAHRSYPVSSGLSELYQSTTGTINARDTWAAVPQEGANQAPKVA
jgi:hypothetical protein